MFKLIPKIVFLILLFIFYKNPESEVLIFDLSDKNIQISKTSSNADFTIFGFTDSKNSLVLKVKGPSQKVILQKKKKNNRYVVME